MRLTGLFSGAEALNAQGTGLAAIADDIANSNTIGFKSTRTEFENIIADSIGSLYGSEKNPGNGARVQDLRIRHDLQGSLELTSRGLDLAVQGNGYFLVNNGTDSFLTRAGNFSVNADGQIILPSGEQLMGFTTASPTTAVPLAVSTQDITATASTTATLTGNLNAEAPIVTVPADTTSFSNIRASSPFETSVSVFDSLGARHDISLFFFHTANLEYTVQAYVDGGETGGAVGTPVQVGSGTITFPATGVNDPTATVTPIALSATWGNGASASSIALDTSDFTGFAASSALTAVSVDGNSAGSVTGYEVAEDGTLNALLDSGGRFQIGTVVLTNVVNKDALQKIGDNKFAIGEGAGEQTTAAPKTGGLGAVVGGALENSTVDPAGEFIDMIRFQRGYQAGSQVIKTISELISSTLQLA